MSRTKRRVPQKCHVTSVDACWQELQLSFIRGHRSGNDARLLCRNGSWYYEDLDIPGRNHANAKRYLKRQTTKMRRREAKRELEKLQ